MCECEGHLTKLGLSLALTTNHLLSFVWLCAVGGLLNAMKYGFVDHLLLAQIRKAQEGKGTWISLISSKQQTDYIYRIIQNHLQAFQCRANICARHYYAMEADLRIRRNSKHL